MNIATIIILGLIIVFVSADGKMDYTQCDIFIDKLGSDQNAISFKGSVSINGDGEDVMIEISYIDQYYLDSSLFGLVTEDGKTPETTCLDLKIYRYYDGLTNSVLVNDLQVTNAHDDANSTRSYILTFKANEFKNKLNETISTSYYTYSGTYAFVFKLSQDPWQIQHIYRFSFSIKLNGETRKILDTSFNQISSSSVQNCDSPNDPKCNLAATSELLFCKNEACSEFYTTAPIIYLNDNVFMLHRTTTSGLSTFKYSASEIQFVADGLLKKATLDAVVYNAGNATYKFKAPIAWSKLRIQATTTLISPKSRLLSEGNFRILADATTRVYLQAYSDETCVQIDAGSTGCPTCAAICKANQNDAPAVCNCSESGQLLLALSFLLVLLMF